MFYISTRSKAEKVSFSQAIIEGMAKDGGLFVCNSFPKIGLEDINSIINMSYQQRACFILRKFLTDFKYEDIKFCVKQAYSAEKFASDNIVELKNLNSNLFVLELWHGPTAAFKDMALQLLPHIMGKAIKICGCNKKALILTATSGDTGKAALEGFKNVENTEIFVFYPKNGVSKMQELQMITQDGNNVHVCAIDGNFDDAQHGVKNILSDLAFKEMLNENGFFFSTANSINWGRLVAQIVYYFSAYCDIVKKGHIKVGDKINFVVPTGNFGNILAWKKKKKMGLFVEDIVAASNRNCVITDFINTGIYNKNREFFKTISPSMDILVSSNLERLIFDISSHEYVYNVYSEFEKNGKFELNEKIFGVLKNSFYGEFCSDIKTKETINVIYKNYEYLCDPHTAVALNCYFSYANKKCNNFKTVVVSTASPFKFAEDVLNSLGGKENLTDIEALSKLSLISKLKVPPSFMDIYEKKIRFSKVIDINSIKDYIYKELNLKG